MKTIDALNILSITGNEITQDHVKSAYRKASKTYHPDINPAGLAMMQAVNEACETLMQASFPIMVSESDVISILFEFSPFFLLEFSPLFSKFL